MGKQWALETDNLKPDFQVRYQVVLCPGTTNLMFQDLLSSSIGGDDNNRT